MAERYTLEELKQIRLCRIHYHGPDGKNHGSDQTCVLCMINRAEIAERELEVMKENDLGGMTNGEVLESLRIPLFGFYLFCTLVLGFLFGAVFMWIVA